MLLINNHIPHNLAGMYLTKKDLMKLFMFHFPFMVSEVGYHGRSSFGDFSLLGFLCS
jgi:hypothetical protein